MSKLLDLVRGLLKYDSAQPRDDKGRWTSDAFQSWFDGSKIVDKEGNPAVAYHGSPFAFDEFQPEKSNPRNYWGKGAYFTSSPADASVNYADRSGPDFSVKLDESIERRMGEGSDFDTARESALAEEFGGGKFSVFPVHLALRNPAYVGGGSPTLLGGPIDYNEDTEEESGPGMELYHALSDAVQSMNQNHETFGKLWDRVSTEMIDNDGITVEALKEAADSAYIEDENGNFAGGELVGRVLRNLGYDGIVDRGVSRFRMDHVHSAEHYVVFDPRNVKSVFNRTPTKESADLLKASRGMGKLTPLRPFDIIAQASDKYAENRVVVKFNDRHTYDAAVLDIEARTLGPTENVNTILSRARWYPPTPAVVQRAILALESMTDSRVRLRRKGR